MRLLFVVGLCAFSVGCAKESKGPPDRIALNVERPPVVYAKGELANKFNSSLRIYDRDFNHLALESGELMYTVYAGPPERGDVRCAVTQPIARADFGTYTPDGYESPRPLLDGLVPLPTDCKPLPEGEISTESSP